MQVFENIDLKKNIDKEEYKALKEKYEEKLGELQRKAKELKIPLIKLLEGWGASGKGTLINKIILPLDPRGLKVYTTDKLSEDEINRLTKRVEEIRDMDKSDLTLKEKKELKKELREIKETVKKDGGYIYIGAGTILVILLIVLLVL
jgi:exopolyphosphatase/pppGpp-phosphohydrolase